MISFMKAFNIDRFEKEIGPDVRLSDFLHFYETVEEACGKTLIQRTHPKYLRELDSQETK